MKRLLLFDRLLYPVVFGIVMFFVLSCSSTSETKKKEDLQKWVGNYFYGGDSDGQGIILTIDSVGNSINGLLSDGSNRQVIHIGEDGNVFVGGNAAILLNDTIRFSSYFQDDTVHYSLPRVTDAWIASMREENERITEEKKYVKIGTQTWMASDLATHTYSNGDLIPEAKSAEEWKKCNDEKIGCWCYFDNDKNQNVLYNWYSVIDGRGLAPKGSKIPSFDDFMTLENFLGGEAEAGIQMKSEGFHPPRDNDGSLNFSRFNAVGAGYRQQNWKPSEFRGKTTNGVGGVVFYWAVSFDLDGLNNPQPRPVGLYIDSRRLHKNVEGSITSGLTVRCIRLNGDHPNESLNVSARLIYEDGSMSDFDILNDKSVILWNVFASEGDRMASEKTRFFLKGNIAKAEIKIMNGDQVLYSKHEVQINGKQEIEVDGTGCGKLTILVSDGKKVIYTGGVEFGCGE